MTAEESELLRTLEGRVSQLAWEYKSLKQRHAELTRKMEESEQTIRELNARAEKLQRDYADLKTAKMIDISSGDMKNAKDRLSKLVREVDKCIALLKV